MFEISIKSNWPVNYRKIRNAEEGIRRGIRSVFGAGYQVSTAIKFCDHPACYQGYVGPSDARFANELVISVERKADHDSLQLALANYMELDDPLQTALTDYVFDKLSSI